MDLREKILITAIDQFRQTGLKFTMQDVAEQARISKKTIYTVFASKEERIASVMIFRLPVGVRARTVPLLWAG